MKTPYVLSFQEIDKTKINVVGGKGANLGELVKIEGIHVPDGFCVSTAAFQRVIVETSALNPLLDQLSQLQVEERAKIGALCAEIRRVIEETAIPKEIAHEIAQAISQLGENEAYAIRSSATALPLWVFSSDSRRLTGLWLSSGLTSAAMAAGSSPPSASTASGASAIPPSTEAPAAS